jgi:Na+/H+ antiporter NhaD/arsenite permease-like protein
MMIMVEAMAKAGFFRWLCLTIAKALNYRVIPLFIAFMVMSSVLAMFIDSITVIMFLAAVTVELARLLRFDPVPMIIAEIFCSNLGGAATMCGDPPNIIIGTELGYSFGDFLVNTGVISLAALVLAVLFFYFSLRKQLVVHNTAPGEAGHIEYPDPKSAIKDRKGFFRSWAIFAIAVLLLVTHSQTGLTVATIGVLIAAITLVFAENQAMKLLKTIDYRTLLFFVGLFVVVGGLEQTGLLSVIAGVIAKLSGGNIYLTVAISLWISAICSGFVDNIPFAATMVPIIESLSASLGIPLSTLAWTLSIGTDFGGNATPIGASANVVGVSIAAKNGHLISWSKYCRYAIPATIITVATGMVMIYLIHC